LIAWGKKSVGSEIHERSTALLEEGLAGNVEKVVAFPGDLYPFLPDVRAFNIAV
jgi:hypothetical protein